MISVACIVTFYNKGNLLFDAINSVINQLDESDELIVVNDCSTESESITVLQKAQQDFPTITFVDTEQNGGAAAAKDYGIRLATSDIIVLLDADDDLPENSVSIIREQFDLNSSLSLLFGDYLQKDTVTGETKVVSCETISDSSGFIDPYALAKHWILLGTSPFKRKDYLKANGFDLLYPKTDDIDFHRRFITNGFSCGYVNKTIYNWNQSLEGNSANHSRLDSVLSAMRGFEFYLKYMTMNQFILLMAKIVLKSLYLKINKF